MRDEPIFKCIPEGYHLRLRCDTHHMDPVEYLRSGGRDGCAELRRGKTAFGVYLHKTVKNEMEAKASRGTYEEHLNGMR
jgi:hypothetical protein